MLQFPYATLPHSFYSDRCATWQSASIAQHFPQGDPFQRVSGIDWN